eukprot:CCRYP_014594-RA/>CCRYP_014594-RA protein AED:0.15 eAED:0.54 QI:0/0/0/1/0/0/3/0/242
MTCVWLTKYKQRPTQLTVFWHVDNLKISCKDKFDVTKLIYYLRRIYREEMTMYQGGRGKYIGTLTSWRRYYNLDKFLERIEKSSPTPHSDKQRIDCTFAKDEAMQCHQSTSQLLFFSTRAWKDMQTLVPFWAMRNKVFQAVTASKNPAFDVMAHGCGSYYGSLGQQRANKCRDDCGSGCKKLTPKDKQRQRQRQIWWELMMPSATSYGASIFCRNKDVRQHTPSYTKTTGAPFSYNPMGKPQ